MDLSKIPYKSWYGKMLRLPLRLFPKSLAMPILQGRLKGKKWIIGSITHGCWLGSYEYRKRLLFENSVNRGDVVYDIGAHVGFYTLLASILVEEQGRVFAFEPLPQNLGFLDKHLQLNGITNVCVFNVAVSNCDGISAFQTSSSHSMGHIAFAGIDGQRNHRIEVRTVTLDRLVSGNEAPKPDVIKIDVEGAEMLALVGAQRVLASFHPTIFLATHGDEARVQCFDLLESLGYHIQPIGEGEVENSDEFLAYWIRAV